MTEKVSFDALEGATSLHQASNGDLTVLLERLRSDATLLPDERAFLADIFEGKRKLPQNRHGSLAVKLRDDEIVEEVLLARILYPKVRHLVAGLAGRHGVTPSYIYRKVREVEGCPRESREMDLRVDRWVKRVEALDARMKLTRRLDAHMRSAARRRRARCEGIVN